MALRSARERAFQTLAYEAGGLLFAVPLFALYSGNGAKEGLGVMIALTLAVMLWSPVHNAMFDCVDLRLSGRVASERPHGLRICHALSHEATSVVVSVPILMWLGGLGLIEALIADIGLTLLYTVYAYVFHIVYDRLWPVRRQA